MTKDVRTQFSTVEMTILGLAWLRGPCKAYTLMKELSLSESTYHRSRAGTAYSVTNRFLKLGLLEKIEDDRVQVTPAGEAVLKEWTGPVVPITDIAHSADLLRLRFFFMGVLPQSVRLEFIDRSLETLKEFEQRCQDLIPQNQEIGDHYGALATVCSVLETRARIQWLQFVRPLVEKPLPADEDWTDIILKALNTAPSSEPR
ncbi:MAG: hypothetical protein ABUL72_06560 [Armatimonadota bacterium]